MYFLGWRRGSVDKGLIAKPANQHGRFSQWFLIVKVEKKRFINVATSERRTKKGVQGPPSPSSEVLTQEQEIDMRKQSWCWPRRGPAHHVHCCLGSFASLSHNVVQEVAGTEFSSSFCCPQDFILPLLPAWGSWRHFNSLESGSLMGERDTQVSLYLYSCLRHWRTPFVHSFIHSQKLPVPGMCEMLGCTKSQDQGRWYSLEGRQTNSNDNKNASMECDWCE